MSYEEIKTKLQSNHLYPEEVILVSNEGSDVVGLALYCPPLQKDWRMEAVKEVVGSEFTVSFLPNVQSIVVKQINTLI